MLYRKPYPIVGLINLLRRNNSVVRKTTGITIEMEKSLNYLNFHNSNSYFNEKPSSVFAD